MVDIARITGKSYDTVRHAISYVRSVLRKTDGNYRTYDTRNEVIRMLFKLWLGGEEIAPEALLQSYSDAEEKLCEIPSDW